MNPLLNRLQPYPFARLREAMQGIEPPQGMKPVPLHIGEPKHATPKVITDALTASLGELEKYPLSAGLPELRRACADWAKRRYNGLVLNPDTEILPVLGSREALFSFTQVVLEPVSDGLKPIVVSPNPFYQIYEGAALLGGGEIYFANCNAPDFMPDWAQVPEHIWRRTRLVFVCSPNNPSGSVMQLDDWKELFALQDKYGFVIASDECYSEIYFGDDKPIGGLQAAAQLGRSNKGLVMFTSLSKRSNVPGLRSGFVAGDAELLKAFLLYRTYHGSAMGVPIQRASIAAWNDEEHVNDNRRLYQEKFEKVVPILQQKFDVGMPDASFYIWLKVPDGDDLAFARKLWREAAIQVLPGRFLARDTERGNPGTGYVRIALVADVEECVRAAETIAALCR
ncbi:MULTISPECIES: succinyldiaminopimelate transaminase [unclassified Neisseria]|uniref:succinyldiaminopimelate transaminase n=1 Tax=unclassified Neisseria TaxID=2623750 RepID=UPI002665ADE4|nr:MULTISPECIES: succinyldiaminopimelate transaminase [unclassified Neisseria]MDO1509407.1 succinyldiaminopimelate transaminase [Neisseria sp. MVDL19-042950]MDO1515820.1 succinyldiaminopimelate transaminase [Neisseria sp. MVDL18-041461]MDO1563356.1 succinyldiaminopimelate transaminase [Neisseria sp. MVDL20-010259]